MPEINSHEDKLRLKESLAELVETERTYVSRLMTTYKIHVVGTQTILSENDRNQIFSNLDEILIANDNFYQDLITKCNLETGQRIGETFLKHIANFSVYLVYCKNQTSSIKYLQGKMKDQVLSHYIRNSLMEPECNGLDLASFLLEPVQRLTRYPMLLKQIQKYTNSPSEECNLLAIAIEESENLLNRVNKAMLEGEEFEQLCQLQRRLSSHGKFTHPSADHSSKLPKSLTGLTRNFGERKLIKSGLWIKLRSRRKLLVFLFSDFVLMTEASSGETDLSLLDDEETKLKIYRNAVHLDDIWVMREAESSKIPSQFQNCYELRALELEAHGTQPLLVHLPVHEFDQWIESISMAKRKLKIMASSTSNPESSTNNILGSLKLSIASSSSLPPEHQYYVIISNGAMDQSFSTNPVRGPVPVWNQTFSLPVRSLHSEIKFELFKYDQYKVNESFGEFKLPLENLVTERISTEAILSSQSGIELKIKMEFIPKRIINND